MYSNSIAPIPFDFLPEGLDLIDLEDKDIEQAMLLSQVISHPSVIANRESYLALLALQGFVKWIEKRLEYIGTILQCDTQQARLIPPTQDHQPAAIAQIHLNQFRLCLVSTTSSAHETIELHQAIVTQPAQLAHFYVHVVVSPEAKVAAVRGFIRYDQLQTYCQQHQLSPAHGTYEIPQSCFEPNLDRLLFLATGLNPQAIPLAATALTSPLSRIQQVLLQPAINTANWLNQQVTQFNQALNNFLTLPNELTPELVPSFRGESPELVINLPDMLQAIEQEGYIIPINVRASYQDLVLDTDMIRLIVVTWPLPTGTDEPEWSLLLISQAFSIPATAIQITIRQRQELLTTIELTNPNSYQVQQAIGFLHEQFTVTIANAATELVLPPFMFQD